MKKLLLSSLLGVIAIQFSSAQKQTNNWNFGTYAALTFNSGTAVVVPGSPLTTSEGTAAISDTAGNLLFYTEGVTVWNNNNNPMPNGTGLNGDVSTTQSALVVPDPGNDSLFYVFTLAPDGGPGGFCYSIVNMQLDSGRGDVTVKNTLLQNNVTEKLAGTFHSNNHDIWVMVHEWGSNAFYAYLVTDSGISAPVISNTGALHSLNAIQNTYGQMKFNPCGNKIVAAIGYQNETEVFDFDNFSGIVSNPVNLPFTRHVYGAEFSVDNSKLYISSYDSIGAVLFQFDMNAPNLLASAVVLINVDDLRGMQLAPDGKIYVAKTFLTSYLGVINDPNLPGVSCNYVDLGIDLDPNFMGVNGALSLPGFIQSYFHPDFPNVVCNVPVASLQSSDTVLCEKNCIDFTDLTTGNVYSWQWLFPGAVPASDTAQNPVNICYNNYGTFDVTLIVSNGAGSDTLFLPGFINVLPSPPIPSVSVIGGDTLISSTGVTYQWFLNGNPIPNATQQLFIATTGGIYYVVISDSNDCKSSSTAVTVNSTPDLLQHNCTALVTGVAGSYLDVRLNDCYLKAVSIHLYNMLGEEVYKKVNREVYNGSVNEKIPLRPEPGIYMITITGDRFSLSRKIAIY